MATFTNQAQLSYTGGAVNSNIAVGELLEVLSASKTALSGTYAPGEILTYVISLVNSGVTPITGLTITDDLGGFEVEGATRYPLDYIDGSLRAYAGGVLQTTPTVTAGPPMTITGITVPADGNLMLIYQARANNFASPTTDGSITNTATVTGGGISVPISESATVTATAEPALTITKTISPVPVAENGRVTYTFLIQNTGNSAAEATDALALTDTFNPILTDLAVTLDGTTLTETTDYTYNAATGLFSTVAGRITVPAATYTQDPTTGAYVVTPGVARLVVTGTV